LDNLILSKEEQQTLDVYKQIASEWVKTHQSEDFFRDEFELFTSLLPAGKILDIGCGFGIVGPHFMNNGYDYTGIDASDSMLEEAHKWTSDATFLKMNMRALEFEPDTFDGFWACASILHIPKRFADGVLEEITRVTKSRGIGYISLKKGDREEVRDDGRFFALYQSQEFLKKLRVRGFIIHEFKEKRYENTDWLFFLVEVEK